MVHRAPLVVAAVGQDLLAGLAGEDIEAPLTPPVGAGACKEDPAEQQGLAILQEVIGQQVMLDPGLETGELRGEAVQPGRWNRLTGSDSQYRIQLTARATADRLPSPRDRFRRSAVDEARLHNRHNWQCRWSSSAGCSARASASRCPVDRGQVSGRARLGTRSPGPTSGTRPRTRGRTPSRTGSAVTGRWAGRGAARRAVANRWDGRRCLMVFQNSSGRPQAAAVCTFYLAMQMPTIVA